MRHLSNRSNVSRQRGTTLLEALIAFLLLSLGMLAVTRGQADLRLLAESARQRSEAVRVADEEIESLRGFASLAAQPGLASYDEVAAGRRTVSIGGTDYTLIRGVDSSAVARAKAIDLSVEWTDRRRERQRIAMPTLIAGADPALTGALALKRSSDPALGPFGRAIGIPLAAKDLGDGRSALKPLAGGNVALVFDNRSGWVVGRCVGVSPVLDTRALQPADLLGCDATSGRLISGIVRFSSASPPDAAHANDAPLPLMIAVTLTATPATAPWCATEAVKAVAFTAGGSLHIDNVPLAATPASVGALSWTESGERGLAYHCVVYPTAAGSWSGRVDIVPIGWQLGSGVGDRRVCRHASDLDGSGAIDANIEHPASYSAASGALAQQNYLVVKGNEDCPGGQPIRVAGATTDAFVNLATLLHQP